MTITLNALQKQRRDTASNWTSNNTVLLAGEWGIESDTKKFKIGDGTTAWQSLDYVPIPDTNRLLAGNLTIGGNLTVSGTQTVIDTQTLQVEDKNIEIGKVSTPSDTTADGGGLTLLGSTNKTFNWVNSTDSWTSSENIDLASGKVLKVNGTQVLSATQFTGNSATSTTATNITVADESSDTSCNVLFTTGATGNLPPKTGTNLTFNSSTGALTATSFVGTVTVPDDSITSAKIVDGSIVNADINASAAISGSKLQAASGSNAGSMSASDKSKLDGIAANATADQTASEIVALVAGQIIAPFGITMEDNKSILMGTGSDFRIRHTGSHSDITDEGTGNLRLGSNKVIIGSPTFDETSATFIDDGAVELYYDNSKKLETTSNGVLVSTATGDVYLKVKALENNASSSARLRLETTSNDANCGLEFGDPDDSDVGKILYNHQTDGSDILSFTVAAGEKWRITSDGHFENNSDSGRIKLGASDDLQIYHDGSHSRILDNGTGNLILTSNQVQINNAANTEVQAKFIENGAVEIYHNGSKKLETSSDGITVSGDIDLLDSGFVELRIKSTNNDAVLQLTANNDDDKDWTIRNDYSDSFKLDFRYNNSTKMDLDASGNLTIAATLECNKLGVNTSSPDQIAHIFKASAGTVDSDSNSVLTLENNTHCILQMLSPAANSGRIMFGDPDDNNAGEINYDHNIDSLIIKTGGAERVRLDSSGRLLVGRTSGDFPLDVNGAARIGGIFYMANDQRIQWGGSDVSYIQGNDNDHILFGIASEKMRLTATGLGVGTNSPASKLHISSGTSGDCELIIEADTDNNNENDNPRILFRQDGGVDASAIENVNNELTISNSIASSGIIFKIGTTNGYTNATEKVRFKNDGNCGFGTSSPTAKVHANSATNTATFLAEGDVSNPDYPAYSFSGQNHDNGERGTGMYLAGDNQLAFATVATERLRIDANGNYDFNNGALMASYGSDTNIDAIHHDDGDNAWIFNSDTTLKASTGTSSLRCAAIDFGDSNNAADKLDEYEEGTWTPTLKFGGSTTGITYNNRAGTYTRIGRMVTVNFTFVLTSKGSASGDATVDGLPFNVADHFPNTQLEASGISAFWNNVGTNSANIVFGAMDSGNHLEIRHTVGAEDDTDDMQNGDFENDTSLRGSITYFA